MAPINWHSCFFLLFALVTSCFAVAVVVSSNVVRMALYLVISLAGVAGLFFLAGAAFLGSMQLLVYVGGTLVLLIFGVMLTARGPFVTMRTGSGQWIMAAVLAAALLAVLAQATQGVRDWQGPSVAQQQQGAEALPDATELGTSLIGVRTDRARWEGDASGDGLAGYLLPFEIVSVHLLVVLVGAAYLARARRREY